MGCEISFTTIVNNQLGYILFYLEILMVERGGVSGWGRGGHWCKSFIMVGGVV